MSYLVGSTTRVSHAGRCPVRGSAYGLRARTLNRADVPGHWGHTSGTRAIRRSSMLLLDESRSWLARRLAAVLDEDEPSVELGAHYRNARGAGARRGCGPRPRSHGSAERGRRSLERGAYATRAMRRLPPGDWPRWRAEGASRKRMPFEQMRLSMCWCRESLEPSRRSASRRSPSATSALRAAR